MIVINSKRFRYAKLIELYPTPRKGIIALKTM